MSYIELKYAPHKCKYFCCGDCSISGRTCISDYPECRAAEPKDELQITSVPIYACPNFKGGE